MSAMVQIGKLTLDAPFFQAGLAGYSDAAMRLIARKHGCPYCITEAMLDQFLIRGGRGLMAAEMTDEDHPLGGQLMGSNPQDIAQGATILAKLGYDVIDINLACPVKKIRRKARGGHLLQAPDTAIDILQAVKQTIGDDLPCTLKLRRGTDDSAVALSNFYKIFEAAMELGYVTIVVHGRSVNQKYLGPSDWNFLKNLTQTYPQTPSFTIGGSGDIWTAPDIFNMINQTGVRLVSVARGCIGNPWIFTQAHALSLNQPMLIPTLDQQKNVLLEHFTLSVQLHGEKQASNMMRKFGIKFSTHHPNPDVVKTAFINVKSLTDWQAVLDEYYTPTQAAIHDLPHVD